MTKTLKELLIEEIARREEDMNEYWYALKKHDPTTYSFPFHQARVIEELKKKLAKFN